MSETVYEKLQALLDRHPMGFPSAPEAIDILRILFTEEEAAMALGLSFVPLPAEEVAKRAGVDPNEAARRLESLDKKALATPQKKDGVMRYALPAPAGILNARLFSGVHDETTEKVSRLVLKYLPVWEATLGTPTTSYYRTIPI
jgi:hypothetical protein